MCWQNVCQDSLINKRKGFDVALRLSCVLYRVHYKYSLTSFSVRQYFCMISVLISSFPRPKSRSISTAPRIPFSMPLFIPFSRAFCSLKITVFFKIAEQTGWLCITDKCYGYVVFRDLIYRFAIGFILPPASPFLVY